MRISKIFPIEIFMVESINPEGLFYEDLHNFHLDLILVAYFKNNADFCV